MDLFRQQLRFAARRLVRAPLFTLTALITLGVGIGANTAIFSVVNGVLLQPLPFDDSDDLIALWHEAPGLGFDILSQSPATYLTYRSDMRGVDDVAMWAGSGAQVTGLDEPEQVETLLVTDGFLPLLRVQPVLGRGFSAADDAPGAAETIVLTHGYWQRAFGGDPEVIGRALSVDGRPREIIGVLGPDFRFLTRDPAFLYPARLDPAEVFMGNFSYQAFARVSEGVALEQVEAEIERLIPVATERYPGPVTLSMMEQARFGAVVRPLKEDIVGNVRPVLLVLLGTVGMVLLIASANVANLFLVRAEGRMREVALRSALGADRREIATHFLSESVLLGVLGGALGLVLAWGGLQVLLAMAPGQLPRLDEIGMDPTVLGFTLAISVFAGMLFGLFPLTQYGRPDLVPALKEGGRGGGAGRERHRARNVLVVAQVALALVLLVGSGLMIRSFQALRNVDPGFERPDEVLTFRVAIPEAVLEDIDETALAYEQMQRALEALPGVGAASATQAPPMGGWDSSDAVFVEDAPTPEGQIPPVRRMHWVLPGYFGTLGIPLLAGRDLEWADTYERRPVVVVAESFAREYWDDPRAALGRRIANINIVDAQDLRWHEIVGVVGDVHDDGLDQEPTEAVYWPMVREDPYGEGVELRRSMAFVVRARGGGPGGGVRGGSEAAGRGSVVPEGLLAEARQAVWSVRPEVPLAQVQTLGDLVSRSLARTSFTLVMLGIAAAVALLLGAVGIYGVISYSVSQRTREIGVRMALGAERGDVRRMVVGQGMVLTGIGLAVGLVSAFVLTRLMASMLYGVEPVDLPTYALVAAALTAVAALASWLPARRASSIDPLQALKAD